MIESLKSLPTPESSLTSKFKKYISDPVGFSDKILGVHLVPKQQEAMESLLTPPYRVLCPSGNSLGKSLMAACTVLWWHCTRVPAKIITTAPTKDQVEQVLWSEIRTLAERAELELDFMPRACQIWRGPNDFAIGMTARSEEAFKGKHGPNQLYIFDEAIDVDPEFWNAVETMFVGKGHAWLCLYNPTSAASRAYDEQNGTGKTWHVVRMSALDHPNIERELRGEDPEVPDAVRLDWFESILKKNSQLVSGRPASQEVNALPTDVVWPPEWATDYCVRTKQFPRYWRPGPKAEVMLLGRFPRQGSNAVWSDGDWIAAIREGLDPLVIPLEIPEIGCDVASGGMDNTAIHVRCGPCSIYHEEANGQSEPATMGRLVELTKEYAHWYNQCLSLLPESERQQYTPITWQDIPVKIDCDGLGSSLSNFMVESGMWTVKIGAGTRALVEKDYPNRRSELWFTTAEMARADELDLSRLPEEVRDTMRRQAMSVTWSFDSRGRRVVMPKLEMRKLMGRSPDTMDAFNLAYAATPGRGDAIPEVLYSRTSPLAPRQVHEQKQRQRR